MSEIEYAVDEYYWVYRELGGWTIARFEGEDVWHIVGVEDGYSSEEFEQIEPVAKPGLSSIFVTNPKQGL